MKHETSIGIVISLMIIVAVIGFILISAINLFKNLPFEEESCEIVGHSLGNKNVILRVDDIQAHAWNSVQKRIIMDALMKNITLSLGVIPNHLEKDQMIYKLLKENRCELEIALHGFNNLENEFLNISFEEAEEKINKGLKILNNLEPKIVTFIPPNNELSDESEKAVKKRFRINSAGWWNSKYGYTQTTYNWDENKIVPHNEIIEGCNKDFSAKKPCIIMIHPQDFATNGKLDRKKYKEFIGLLNELKEINAAIINFRDL